jgi:hypothetical protein
MAMSAANVAAASGANIRTFDITSTANADTDVVVAHGLSFTPDVYIICPTIATAAAGSCYSITTVGATNFTAVKSTNVGSGPGGVVARYYVGRFHSIID